MTKHYKTSSHANPGYRSDIDGLRAVAVMLVVLYHFDVKALSGGFVGVDIFFVISGFLITRIIANELHDGSFQFKNFWSRRIKRLLPASLTMVLVVLLVFSLVFPSALLQDVAKSSVSQFFFVSNIYFWSGAGYFEVASNLKPLLHTWSLSVEEQFYFIFPFYLFLMHRLQPTFLMGLTMLLTIGSFVFCVILYNYETSGAFFWLPTRAWELGTGACLALMANKLYPRNSTIALIATATGLLLVIGTALTFTKLTPFPSYFAMLPVAGTALILWGNSNLKNSLRTLFCLKPFVFIGLISYSLYLWHWPIKVLMDWYSVPLDHTSMCVIALLATLCISTLSYYLIEQPFRVTRQRGI